ncbi:esterase-like activity of phytase family protein [uncultured Nitratireductor sp.]|uniref:esterase-like activity of phytase family protein n=1 Tax=uncultured Nitratireductor sp. TaxID=520953 RepID=UPI0025DFC8C7|nr:esterase-like activity of phytase family protein [uncultured Nitratireductor sp.]
MRGVYRWLGRGVLLAFAFVSTAHAQEPAIPTAVNAVPIRHFAVGSHETRFGPLEFVGGLSMSSPVDHFGAFSSFRFTSPGAAVMGVSDTGFWFFGTLIRDAEGRPAGFADFSMQPMVDGDGNSTREKWTTDAEGIAVKDELATVSFERVQRIAEFEIERDAMGAAVRDLDFLVPRRELRSNRGFETIAYAPPGGRLGGARVVVAERSIDEDGNCFAAILEGPMKGIFKVARSEGFDITDGAFLPDGDLLLLERRFAFASGVAMRLRRIDGATVAPGSVADGPVLFTAGMDYQIDNMEALDVWQRADGATMVSLMSDDNHSLLQRNLYLEFRLHGD